MRVRGKVLREEEEEYLSLGGEQKKNLNIIDRM